MDLIASRRYQPDTEEPAEIDYIMMPVSELPVSAGLGAFLEGEMFQQIQVCLPVAFRLVPSSGYTLAVIVWSHVIITDRLYG